jgi:general secretion pathway protein G
MHTTMKNSLRQIAAKGFTLIELLIVVIIIAILAAIAIPQFGNSTAEATDAALDANLATMRSAIELYRAQHNNNYPGAVAAAAAANCAAGGVSAALAGGDQATFTAHMTQYSNREGQTCSVPSPGYNFGPYMRASPRDPLTPAANAAASNVAVTAVVFGGAPAASAPGWRFNTADGRFEMNSLALDRNNVAYWTH